jgi:hypothetical protein
MKAVHPAIYYPTPTKFSIYIQYLEGDITSAQANAMNWYVNWMGIESYQASARLPISESRNVRDNHRILKFTLELSKNKKSHLYTVSTPFPQVWTTPDVLSSPFRESGQHKQARRHQQPKDRRRCLPARSCATG